MKNASSEDVFDVYRLFILISWQIDSTNWGEEKLNYLLQSDLAINYECVKTLVFLCLIFKKVTIINSLLEKYNSLLSEDKFPIVDCIEMNLLLRDSIVNDLAQFYLDKALSLIEDFDKRFNTVEALFFDRKITTVIDKLSSVGDFELALSLREKIESEQQKVDSTFKIVLNMNKMEIESAVSSLRVIESLFFKDPKKSDKVISISKSNLLKEISFASDSNTLVKIRDHYYLFFNSVEIQNENISSIWKLSIYLAKKGYNDVSKVAFLKVQKFIKTFGTKEKGILCRDLLLDFISIDIYTSSPLLFINTSEVYSYGEDVMLEIWESLVEDICKELGPDSDDYDNNFERAIKLILEDSRVKKHHISSCLLEIAIVYYLCGAEDDSIIALILHALDYYDGDADTRTLINYTILWVNKYEIFGEVSISDIPSIFLNSVWVTQVAINEYKLGRYENSLSTILRVEDLKLLNKYTSHLIDDESFVSVAEALENYVIQLMKDEKDYSMFIHGLQCLAQLYLKIGDASKALMMLNQLPVTFERINSSKNFFTEESYELRVKTF